MTICGGGAGGTVSGPDSARPVDVVHIGLGTVGRAALRLCNTRERIRSVGGVIGESSSTENRIVSKGLPAELPLSADADRLLDTLQPDGSTPGQGGGAAFFGESLERDIGVSCKAARLAARFTLPGCGLVAHCALASCGHDRRPAFSGGGACRPGGDSYRRRQRYRKSHRQVGCGLWGASVRSGCERSCAGGGDEGVGEP